MKILIHSIILVIVLNITVYSQNYSTTPSKKTNSWAIGFQYADNGYGFSGTYYQKLGRITDMMYKLSFTGISDPSEVQYYDYYTGESVVRDKINRIYAMTLNVGIKHNIFFDDIDGNFKPFVKAGVAPTLIMMTPYDRGFFKAFGYGQTSYAIGPYAGIGIEYYESKSIGLSICVEYSYLPVIGRDVSSILNKNITDVGGLQFSFNFMFL
jgi:hypothetical protein